MVTLRQRTTAATGEPEPKLEEEKLCEDLTILSDDSDDSPSDSTVKHLRERWELASVLNFLNVFGPLVSEKLKLTAEEIEMGLIECNTTNAQLHISLLKDGHDSTSCLVCLLLDKQILPVNIKGLAGSIATLANWFFSWLITMTANLLLAWSSGGTFTLYGLVCAFTVVFVTLWVPETKGKTLEELQALFR